MLLDQTDSVQTSPFISNGGAPEAVPAQSQMPLAQLRPPIQLSPPSFSPPIERVKYRIEGRWQRSAVEMTLAKIEREGYYGTKVLEKSYKDDECEETDCCLLVEAERASNGIYAMARMLGGPSCFPVPFEDNDADRCMREIMAEVRKSPEAMVPKTEAKPVVVRVLEAIIAPQNHNVAVPTEPTATSTPGKPLEPQAVSSPALTEKPIEIAAPSHAASLAPSLPAAVVASAALPSAQPAPPASDSTKGTVVAVALDYLKHGFSIVPQLPGQKHPCVKWKPYQTRLPTEAELTTWFQQWPNAGLAVILGSVSNLFCIDVDGSDAHAALLARLGHEPKAPKVLSGSGLPDRYHLYFRNPVNVVTKAKYTPWHSKLEFRGERGIVVLPPSVHKSGKKYEWAEGQGLADLALTDLPAAVVDALRQGAEQDCKKKMERQAAVTLKPIDPQSLDQRQELARAYVAKLPPGMEGQGGDKQTFTVACYLVRDFDLSPDQALPLMQEYNLRCQPPWSAEELRHKLAEADKQNDPRGRLLVAAERKGRSSAAKERDCSDSPQQSEPFLGDIPDFILADWAKVKPHPRQRQRGRCQLSSGLNWLVHRLVIHKKQSGVIVPDLLVAQIVWGGIQSTWPRNWRRQVAAWIGFKPNSVIADKKCPDTCPSRDADARHEHFRLVVNGADKAGNVNLAFLGVLEHCCESENDGVRKYNWEGPEFENDQRTQMAKECIEDDRRSGRRSAVYLPVLVFGPSPLSGLTHEQRNVLITLTHEITRQNTSQRPDKARLFVGGECVQIDTTVRLSLPPALAKNEKYVGFNGNGAYRRKWLRGRGYHLVGRNKGGWLQKAGYKVADDMKTQRQQVREFLTNLAALTVFFR
jgi:hypothetical protein